MSVRVPLFEPPGEPADVEKGPVPPVAPRGLSLSAGGAAARGPTQSPQGQCFSDFSDHINLESVPKRTTKKGPIWVHSIWFPATATMTPL